MKQMLLAVTAFFLMSVPVMAQDSNPLAGNVTVKLMPGIMVETGAGGALDAVLFPKKLEFPVKPALNLGIGSRMTSVEQTGEDITTHAGLQLCVYEAVCAGRGYDFNDQDQRWLFNLDVMNIYGLVTGE